MPDRSLLEMAEFSAGITGNFQMGVRRSLTLNAVNPSPIP